VQLYYAGSGHIVIGSAVVERWISGYICIENIAHEKDVIIHYSVENGEWQQKNWGRFGFVQPAPEPGKEVWSFNINLPSVNYDSAWTGLEIEPWEAVDVEFAIEYRVAGSTYWDNNGGNNYKISSAGIGNNYSTAALGRSLVAKERYVEPINSRDYYDKVRVAVANIGYEKDVSIVYSTNDWLTTELLLAEYDGSSADGTIDFFIADLPGYSSYDCLQYAISYEVNGTTMWDNNFGNNYKLGSCN
jgi:hypothetical protein